MQICRQLFAGNIFPWLSVKCLTFPWQLSNSPTFLGFPDKWSPCEWSQLRCCWLKDWLHQSSNVSLEPRVRKSCLEILCPYEINKEVSKPSEPAPSELSQNSEKQRLTKRCLLRQLWRQSVDSFLPRLVNIWQIILLFIQHTTRVLRWSIRLTRFDIQFTCWKTPLTYDNDSILQQSQFRLFTKNSPRPTQPFIILELTNEQ